MTDLYCEVLERMIKNRKFMMRMDWGLVTLLVVLMLANVGFCLTSELKWNAVIQTVLFCINATNLIFTVVRIKKSRAELQELIDEYAARLIIRKVMSDVSV